MCNIHNKNTGVEPVYGTDITGNQEVLSSGISDWTESTQYCKRKAGVRYHFGISGICQSCHGLDPILWSVDRGCIFIYFQILF